MLHLVELNWLMFLYIGNGLFRYVLIGRRFSYGKWTLFSDQGYQWRIGFVFSMDSWNGSSIKKKFKLNEESVNFREARKVFRPFKLKMAHSKVSKQLLFYFSYFADNYLNELREKCHFSWISHSNQDNSTKQKNSNFEAKQ